MTETTLRKKVSLLLREFSPCIIVDASHHTFNGDEVADGDGGLRRQYLIPSRSWTRCSSQTLSIYQGLCLQLDLSTRK